MLPHLPQPLGRRPCEASSGAISESGARFSAALPRLMSISAAEKSPCVMFAVLLAGIGALAMLVTATVAWSGDDLETARPFFYGAVLFLMITAIVGLATARYVPESGTRPQLFALIAALTVLPVMLAVPFAEAVPNARFLNETV